MNNNCLKDMRCPRCKSEGPFKIAGSAVFEVHDDGADTFGDLEWGDDSYCGCRDCGHEGIVADFQIKKRTKKVTCKFCAARIHITGACKHDGKYVCESCWDERLKSTE